MPSDRFDNEQMFGWIKDQVSMGARRAGSAALLHLGRAGGQHRLVGFTPRPCRADQPPLCRNAGPTRAGGGTRCTGGER